MRILVCFTKSKGFPIISLMNLVNLQRSNTQATNPRGRLALDLSKPPSNLHSQRCRRRSRRKSSSHLEKVHQKITTTDVSRPSSDWFQPTITFYILTYRRQWTNLNLSPLATKAPYSSSFTRDICNGLQWTGNPAYLHFHDDIRFGATNKISATVICSSSARGPQGACGEGVRQ